MAVPCNNMSSRSQNICQYTYNTFNKRYVSYEGVSMIRNTNDMLKTKLSYRRPSIQRQWSTNYDLARPKTVNFGATGRPQYLHRPDVSPQNK